MDKPARVRVKICGITNSEDGHAAIAAGADALGFNFYPSSQRYLAPDAARLVVRGLSPFVQTVGLFVDPESSWVERVLSSIPLNLLQFHGNETDAFCASFDRPYIKAIRVGVDTTSDDIRDLVSRFPAASGFLVDTLVSGLAGGTGVKFDWEKVPHDLESIVVLAGGLTPQNVKEAIEITKPYAVDLCGGVESSPGKKDAILMGSFMSKIREI